jgi:hypothetical protein
MRSLQEGIKTAKPFDRLHYTKNFSLFYILCNNWQKKFIKTIIKS